MTNQTNKAREAKEIDYELENYVRLRRLYVDAEHGLTLEQIDELHRCEQHLHKALQLLSLVEVGTLKAVPVEPYKGAEYVMYERAFQGATYEEIYKAALNAAPDWKTYVEGDE